MRGTSQTTGEVQGVLGTTMSATPGAAGVLGEGPAVGVAGRTTATGSGIYGVHGETNGNSGWASGVYGLAHQSGAIGCFDAVEEENSSGIIIEVGAVAPDGIRLTGGRSSDWHETAVVCR